MEIELSGLGTSFFLLAIGLSLMGYFIGKGLQNMGQGEKASSYYMFIKESELEFYLHLEKAEISELLEKYPDAPKIKLNGTTYYPYKPFMNWISHINE